MCPKGEGRDGGVDCKYRHLTLILFAALSPAGKGTNSVRGEAHCYVSPIARGGVMKPKFVLCKLNNRLAIHTLEAHATSPVCWHELQLHRRKINFAPRHITEI